MAEVTGSLWRKDGKRCDTWVARLRVDGDPVKRTLGKVWTSKGRPAAGFLTEAMASEALNDLMADLRRGREVVQGRKTGKTFGNAADGWLRYLRVEKGRKLSTLDSYARLMPRLYRALGEVDTPLEKVTTKRITGFRDDLRSEGRAESTVAKYMNALSGIFKYAVKEMGLKVNPMDGVEWSVPEPNHDFEVFKAEEIIALSGAASNDHDAALFLVAGFTGMRTGELRALPWGDIDWDNATINVRHNFPINVTRRPQANDLRRYTTKGGKPRPVPLPEQCVPALKRWRLASVHSTDDDLVFSYPHGDVLNYHAMRRRFIAAQQRAKLFPQRRFHDLRHSAGTLFARIFPSAFDVQDIMGHADLKTTRNYVHMAPKGDEAKRLSEAIAKATRPKQRGRRAA